MSILLDPELVAWEQSAPKGLREDVIWKFHTYRVALFVLHVVRVDLARVRGGAQWMKIADQLLRSAASVSANIGEGYARSLSEDRARFYDMALGSLRECTSWYDAARTRLPAALVDHRIDQMGELRRMLFGALRHLRRIPAGTRLY